MHPRSLGASGARRPPVSLTSLVGREREIRDLEALLAARRLVTLTGVGGAGKTRLAAELALRIEWQRADSVAWVDLAVCAESQLVVQHVASALSLRGPHSIEALAEAVEERKLLLVLDNCEHVVDACAELARTLLTSAAKLRILATSREALGVAGEHVWPVPPIAEAEAKQLFAERAAAVEPAFAITDANARAVEEICARLDGIPLAIELAAARVRVLSVEQIATRLEDCFAILSGSARTTVPRHRTLRAAIDWSYALLTEREQALLAQLSVFAGGFSLESAEAVCDADLDVLTSLVDKSLIARNTSGAVARYSMLETIRQYAAERLAARGETDAFRRRHALAVLDLARSALADPRTGIVFGLDRLSADYDNVRAALSWSLEHEPEAIALPLGAAFRWHWYYRILWSEGLRWLTRILDCGDSSRRSHSSSDRAAVLSTAGAFAAYLGERDTARQWLNEAETMWRALGDDRELALTLCALAHLHASTGDLDAASGCATNAIALARVSGTPYDIGYCLANAAAVAQRRDDLDEADRELAEAESIWVAVEHRFGLPFVLSARALLAVRRGDPAAAAVFARAALTESRSWNYHWFAARALRVLAFTSTNDLPRAARLLGAADAILRTLGVRMLEHEKSERERLLATLRESMTAEALEAALREGGSMSIDDACVFALDGVKADEESVLHIADLGALRITRGERRLVSPQSRAFELLVFLSLHPNGVTREEAGVAFWPDATTEQVKNAFHVTLHRLRRLLGDSDAVVADGARYRIAIPFRTDSQQFESAMTDALRGSDAARIESALALYAGDFLQGEELGDWVFPVRTRLRELHLRGLFALAQIHESRGRYAEAAETYARVLSRDPFHEESARRLMICRARLGARSESLLVYRQLEQRLREDLQAAPEPETASLYRKLRQNEAV